MTQRNQKFLLATIAAVVSLIVLIMAIYRIQDFGDDAQTEATLLFVVSGLGLLFAGGSAYAAVHWSSTFESEKAPPVSHRQRTQSDLRQTRVSLIAIRDAIEALESRKVNQFFVDGRTYSRSDLSELRRMERELSKSPVK